MQPVWLCIFSGRWFEETFDNIQWRKVQQMQPMWLCIFSGRQFEDSFENAHLRKAKQMQPIWIWMYQSKCIEVTFKNINTFKTERKWTIVGKKREPRKKLWFWSKQLVKRLQLFGPILVSSTSCLFWPKM